MLLCHCTTALLTCATCRKLEEYMAKYGELVSSFGERPPTIRKVDTVEEVLEQADVRPAAQ